MSEFPPASVVIVNWNGQRHLERLLPSLEALQYPQDCVEIIVVDNGSSDHSVEWLKTAHPRVRVLQHDRNNYAAANNYGIHHAKGQFIALLNNDCWVAPQWLRHLVQGMEAHQRIGAVGSKILLADGMINSAGLHELPNVYWENIGFQEPDFGQYEQSAERVATSGCAMLIRRSCLDEVGLFDEEFEMYYEDVDWCLRAQTHNWKIWYIPTSVVWHAFHGTASRETAQRYVERNRLLLIAKHHPQQLPAALESATFFLEQSSLEGCCDAVYGACAKLMAVHGREVSGPVLLHVIAALSKILRGYSTMSTLKLQQQLGDARNELEHKKGESRHLIVLQQGLDRALQTLAEERDTQQVVIAQLQEGHRQVCEERNTLQQRLSDIQRLLWYRVWSWCGSRVARVVEAWLTRVGNVSEVPNQRRAMTMTTAKLLKVASWSVLLAGGGLAAEAFATHQMAAAAWCVAGAIGTLCVRVLANIGQLLFEQRGELQRLLGNMERGVFQQGAWTKEVRDILKERDREARAQGSVLV